jgi:hypothetical protein
VRGSNDFDSFEGYRQFIREVLEGHNKHNAKNVEIERAALQELPKTKAVDYTEATAVVSSTSTIEVRRVTYTVPSRLIGQRLLVRIYADQLMCYVGNTHTATLPRASTPPRGKRGRQINFHHVIDSLIKKRHAFNNYRLRDELLPNDAYRFIWNHVDSTMDQDSAGKFMVGLLYLASKQNCLDALADVVITKIHAGELLNLVELQHKFAPPNQVVPQTTTQQHALKEYDNLIPNGERSC